VHNFAGIGIKLPFTGKKNQISQNRTTGNGCSATCKIQITY